MKGGPFRPAISTGGAAFAALGSFLANGGPPSVAHGQLFAPPDRPTHLTVALVQGGRF
ncbi:hypothetical protein PF005_g1029 [Phytophthora fragariae]|uniref:Uncharacterized protein n=1 Tax=Phytophthora fragariae TaxID=53985 RepID=A0A6A3UX72_9STRA|nr:hypothetical protein PF003_g33692 [Phytophthora fragariae]KAE8949472.1 hypothetical protein PF009_g966 [Phytophthora fragariae]KAE9136215.1 hypothetical protein PF010_g1786 [Phytophthora fragariae]KAE9139186.1 hypothetical protein PF007_g1096 [Phytophthora fragariae]KAE9155186.1 hypothetical protein PF006_g853 [Phytophthora fragariae]